MGNLKKVEDQKEKECCEGAKIIHKVEGFLMSWGRAMYSKCKSKWQRSEVSRHGSYSSRNMIQGTG